MCAADMIAGALAEMTYYTDWLGEAREWRGWQSTEEGWVPVREAAAMWSSVSVFSLALKP